MVPNAGKGIDAVNFRSVKESESVDISAAKVRGIPLGSDMDTPGDKEFDPFEEFNSGRTPPSQASHGHTIGITDCWDLPKVTLHHDGDHDHHHHQLSEGTSSEEAIHIKPTQR
jgi:protein-serine/threonine kinase